VRAYRAWPQAFTTADDGLLKVLRATPLDEAKSADSLPGRLMMVGRWPVVETGDGALRLDEVQPEGRRSLAGDEFLRGRPRLVGSVLGTSVA